jgi:hypothetical protein
MLAEILLICCAAVPVVSPAVAPHPSPSRFGPLANLGFKAACTDTPENLPTPGDNTPPPVLPVLPGATSEKEGVQWGRIGMASVRFVAIMHGFRWATEPGTRSSGFGLGRGYAQSVGNLHGWADGDPFYVNYVGHPMQGAVSGRLFLLNDPRYNRAEFGKSAAYWKGKLRATAFAWAFSEQFEIGPLSEASIGHVQRDFPQQGFVDHVVTPTIGLAWMLGEDAIDRYVIRGIEDRTTNKWVRLALRTALNPARSFANVVDGRVPWARDSRSGIVAYRPSPTGVADRAAGELPPVSKPAPFEFSTAASVRSFASGPCVGGGADLAYRATAELQIVLAVNGCKMLDLPADLSGDALFYQIGPRWTPAPTGKWSPYAHFLVGGLKVTHEQLYRDQKIAVEQANLSLDPMLAYTLHDRYTRTDEACGLAISVGTGVDYQINPALALRVASLEYQRSTIGNVAGWSYGRGLRVSTGMVLRLGTW